MTAQYEDQGWKLEELAQRARVSARTVRYYVQRGLLPAPHFRGRDTIYTQEHLLRLHAIRRLQERYLPLDAIQEHLSRCSPVDLQAIVEDRDSAGERVAAAGRMAAAPSVEPETQAMGTDEERWVRWVLAPGVEVHLSERVEAKTRQAIQALCDEFVRKHKQSKIR